MMHFCTQPLATRKSPTTYAVDAAHAVVDDAWRSGSMRLMKGIPSDVAIVSRALSTSNPACQCAAVDVRYTPATMMIVLGSAALTAVRNVVAAAWVWASVAPRRCSHRTPLGHREPRPCSRQRERGSQRRSLRTPHSRCRQHQQRRPQPLVPSRACRPVPNRLPSHGGRQAGCKSAVTAHDTSPGGLSPGLCHSRAEQTTPAYRAIIRFC
jgi:hypothetical protein